jgi:predicted histidine transporter YuiF (NhaC family)
MKKILELLKSPHIQIALATGLSIIVLAYFSKKILPEPIGYLPLAIPPFIATIYEAVVAKHKNKKIAATWYWVAAILGSTLLIILLNII